MVTMADGVGSGGGASIEREKLEREKVEETMALCRVEWFYSCLLTPPGELY